MSQQKVLSIGGMLLVFISLFTPLVSLPIVGSMNLLQYNVPAAIFTIIVCVGSLYLTIKERYRDILYGSISLLALMVVLFINIYVKIESVKADITKGLEGNMFAGLATAMSAAIRIEWGWALIFIGIGILIASSVIKVSSSYEDGQTISEWASKKMDIKQVSMPNWAWISVILVVMLAFSLAFSGFKGAVLAGNKGKSATTSTNTSVNKVENSLLQAYIANSLELTDLKAQMYNSVLDGKVPGVEFKIRNKGDKALKRVEVTVYFKDKDGKIIYEQKYTPVNMGTFDGGKILKPNYIWQIERGKFLNAKSVPSEWASGAVDAKITAIEFADEKYLMPDMSKTSPEKQYSQDFVEIYDVKTGMYNSILDGRVPGLEFKIKNKGDKNLSEVTVTAYFKDKSGNEIYEQKYYPVSSNSFDGAKVLKAGQIWQIERGKFYTASALPSEWDGSSVMLEVSKLKYE